MTMTRAIILTLAITLGSAPLGQAADGHAHVAPNGGQIQQLGTYEGELVARGGELVLHIVDANERKVDAARLSAIAQVLAAGNQQKMVELTPAGDNRLAGRVDFPVEGKLRATVTLKGVAGETGRARYSLDAK